MSKKSKKFRKKIKQNETREDTSSKVNMSLLITLMEMEKEVVIRDFGTNKTKKRACEIALAAYQDVGKIVEQNKIVNKTKVACKEGCSYCCQLRVAVSIPEAITLFHFINQQYWPEQLEELKSKLPALAKQTSQMTTVDWIKTGNKCPLLVNNSCSMYEVRPLSCRAWNSIDVLDCQLSISDPEKYPIVRQFVSENAINNVVLDGMTLGLKEIGLDGNRLELISALNILFHQEDAIERWLKGENVFYEASLPLLNDPEEPTVFHQISKRNLTK